MAPLAPLFALTACLIDVRNGTSRALLVARGKNDLTVRGESHVFVDEHARDGGYFEDYSFWGVSVGVSVQLPPQRWPDRW